MVIRIDSEKDKKETILYGKKMTEEELRGQIKFAENVADPLHEDFPETLARIYEWVPVLDWEYFDFIYNSDTRTLSEPLTKSTKKNKAGQIVY